LREASITACAAEFQFWAGATPSGGDEMYKASLGLTVSIMQATDAQLRKLFAARNRFPKISTGKYLDTAQRKKPAA
jgi:hypothetical protein